VKDVRDGVVSRDKVFQKRKNVNYERIFFSSLQLHLDGCNWKRRKKNIIELYPLHTFHVMNSNVLFTLLCCYQEWRKYVREMGLALLFLLFTNGIK